MGNSKGRLAEARAELAVGAFPFEAGRSGEKTQAIPIPSKPAIKNGAPVQCFEAGSHTQWIVRDA